MIILFFETERFQVLLNGNTVKKSHNWEINIDVEIKNYCNEIEEFLNWIFPYIKDRDDRLYLGWMKGDALLDPTINIYASCEDEEDKILFIEA